MACWERRTTGVAAGDEDSRDADGAREVGRYRLRDSQLAAVTRIRAAFAVCGGALLADPPGAGKTIVALALGRGATDTVVIGPATLKAQWERSAARAGVAMRFFSFEALSRDSRPVVSGGGLVVVDEAHHARTPGTRRYARLAELCTGARVLLLSATPVVNRAADRDALLGLFLGPRLAASDTSRCIIRRGEVRDARPEVHRLPPLTMPARAGDHGIAALIRTLPPPLPASDGAAALALVRITLAMAWSSSLAALDAALRRRVQRGEALSDSLAAGEWPTRSALRRWIMGDDSTQLAFPGLYGSNIVPPGDAAVVLGTHLSAIRSLRALVSPEVSTDASQRALAIDALQRARPDERLVVFARHAETVRALWAALRPTGGVVALVGDRVLAAHGRWRRDEVLTALGPRSSPLRPGDPRALRIVLATDLLSEGVELQGVGTVVHADRAWTPATMEQREGRVVRPTPRAWEPQPGIPRLVLVTSLPAPRAAATLLELGPRLRRKERARRRAVRRSECLAAADVALALWRTHSPMVQPAGTRAASFLAAIRWSAGGPERVVAGTQVGGRWRINDCPCTIARLASLPRLPWPGNDEQVVSGIRRGLARWARRQATRSAIGEKRTGAPQGPWRQLRVLVSESLRAASLAERAARGAALARSVGTLERRGGAGVRRRLTAMLRARAAGTLTASGFEAALHSLAESARHGETDGAAPDGAIGGRPTLFALVLLAPAHHRLRRAPAPQRPVPEACSPSTSP